MMQRLTFPFPFSSLSFLAAGFASTEDWNPSKSSSSMVYLLHLWPLTSDSKSLRKWIAEANKMPASKKKKKTKPDSQEISDYRSASVNLLCLAVTSCDRQLTGHFLEPDVCFTSDGFLALESQRILRQTLWCYQRPAARHFLQHLLWTHGRFRGPFWKCIAARSLKTLSA